MPDSDRVDSDHPTEAHGPVEAPDDADLLEKAEQLLRESAGSKPLALSVGGAFQGSVGREIVRELEAEREELTKGTEVSRFVVLDQIGEGGMGRVYAAYDPQLDRRVALKILRTRHLGSDRSGLASRLLREARALARLSHPNITAVHDVIDAEGRLAMATELVDGVDLLEWQAEEQRSADRLVAIYLQAAKGLWAAHSAGIIHRDFKPSNVLVGRDGRVRVTDFGLALDQQPSPPSTPGPGQRHDGLGARATPTDGHFGTPGYLAPELLKGAPASVLSDQFAFCVSLYEALMGERPRSDGSRGLDRIPGWLRPILERGLAEDPDDRYPSLEGLIADLARGPGLTARQRVARSAGFGLAALLAVGTLGWSWWSGRGGRVDEPALDPERRGRLVVGPFVNATGDPELDWIGEGLRRMISQTLDDVESLEAVDWEWIRRQRMIVGLDDSTPSAMQPVRIVTDELSQRLLDATMAESLIAVRFTTSSQGLAVTYQIRNAVGAFGERSFQAADALDAGDTLIARWVERYAPQARFPSLADRFSESPFVNQLLALGFDRLSREGFADALQLFEAARELDDSNGWTRLLVAECLSFLGQGEEAEITARQVLDEARDQGHRHLEAAALDQLGVSAEERTSFATGREFLERSAAIYRELGRTFDEAQALIRIGRLFKAEAEATRNSSDPGRVEELIHASLGPYDEGISILRARSDPPSKVLAAYTAGLVAKFRRQFAEAEVEYRTAVTLAKESGLVLGEALALNGLQQVIHSQGRPKEARPYLLDSIAKHRQVENWWGVAATSGNLGELLAEEEEWAPAVEAWSTSLEAAGRFEPGWATARAHRGLGHALTELGDGEGALPHLRAARAFYGDQPEIVVWLEQAGHRPDQRSR